MRYPITPEYLQDAPNYLTELYEDFEADVLNDLCSRLKLSGTVTESALNQIRALQQQGRAFPYIEKKLKILLNTSQAELDKMLDEAVERNQKYYQDVISKSDIVKPDDEWLQMLNQQTDAICRQTKEELRNLTQSMGFGIVEGNKVKFYDIATTYQRILDKAELKIMSGAFDYNTAIRGAVKELTDSGLQMEMVNYASNWHNRVDVAARRAAMTGITQISGRYSEQMMETLETRYVEVTAHSGARNTGDGYVNHESWQGKIYYWSKRGERDPLRRYKDFVQTTGYGTGGGLCGWNCRHSFYPFVPGVNEPTYTASELKNIDPPPFEYQGRKYTRYEATQKQRQIETKMRELKRRLIGFSAQENHAEYTATSIRLKRLQAEYKAFSKAADLREQPERSYVQGYRRKSASRAKRSK